jgi:hypothetical protein
MPTISRKVPAHDAMPVADPAVLKERAYRAWKTARERGALPAPTLDKLWSEGLLAMGDAPPQVRAVMAYRSECLFMLLVDRAGWLAGPR